MEPYNDSVIRFCSMSHSHICNSVKYTLNDLIRLILQKFQQVWRIVYGDFLARFVSTKNKSLSKQRTWWMLELLCPRLFPTCSALCCSQETSWLHCRRNRDWTRCCSLSVVFIWMITEQESSRDEQGNWLKTISLIVCTRWTCMEALCTSCKN